MSGSPSDASFPTNRAGDRTSNPKPGRQIGTPERARAVSQILIGFIDLVFGLTVVGTLHLLWGTNPLVPVIALAVCIIAHGRARITLSVLTQLPTVLRRLAIPLFGLVVVTERFQDATSTAGSTAAIVASVVIARAFSYALLRHLRTRRILMEKAVVVGVGDLGIRLHQILTDHAEFGVEPVGFVDNAGRHLPASYLGDIDNLPTIATEQNIQKVFVAFGIATEETIARKLQVELPNVDVIVVPRLFEAGGGSSTDGMTDHAWGIPLMWLPRRFARRSSQLIKQAIDSTVALVFLVLLSPLLAVVALAVRLSSPGPILYRQIRLGRNGKPFELLKFRSMVEPPDDQVRWGNAEEFRVTKIGSFIRTTSIDELPQLINVIRGDMSIVGPRPERPVFADEFAKTIDQYSLRLRAPAGLTGWAQVNRLRGDSSISDRVRFDNQYIDNWSFWTDIRIVFQTLGALKAPKGVPVPPVLQNPQIPQNQQTQTADVSDDNEVQSA
jgi:exopolysaccharide biosynthesis polyprenyl glycosylphosphotransferase